MRITELHAENIKRLKVVDITPEPFLQVVSGSNASGKSSTLDSIWYALAGKKPIPAKPIRDGEESAVVRLNLGELIVKRTFERTEDGGYRTTLLVLNPVGAEPGTPDKKLPKWNSPQDILDDLVGELSFDPLEFSRQKAPEQLAALRRIVKLPIDIDALDRANAADFDGRTIVNREAKQKRAQADAIVIPPDTPEEAIEESALLDGIQEAGEFNAKIEQRRLKRDQVQREAVQLRAQAVRDLEQVKIVKNKAEERITELERQIRWIREETEAEVSNLLNGAAETGKRADELQTKLDAAPALPEPISIAGLRESLNQAKSVNAAIAERGRKADLLKAAKQMEAEAEALTARIAARDKQKDDAIKAAELPVPGLGFGVDHITYNGQPFDQASSAEQLRVSVAVAMSANPKLRVLRIKDGGLLDDDGLRIISEMAAARDFQVWLEKIDGKGMGIVMESGEVKG